ncbi:MAG: phosphohistidine phosphatase SixA [Phycisphaerales bacterium]|jgi:phosphohistidine phosphatase
MKLYLVQHGNALSKEQDPQRPLSKKGIADLNKIANFIRPVSIVVDYLWHSEKRRAIQTAKILAGAVKVSKDVKSRDGLSPNDDVNVLEKELVSIDGDIMVVGHMPFLGRLASSLLSGSETTDTVKFQQGGIVCLSYDEESGWQLQWMVVPEILS